MTSFRGNPLVWDACQFPNPVDYENLSCLPAGSRSSFAQSIEYQPSLQALI
ncbi:hypothetical protein [Acaryochloris marina]|uniref:Uncharacterized protein n=1 Tax=Acaryochloris marina (strain MBIC 11017) TaxID=329726 RepID=B0C9G9_ACAM1|nr:hypothetical protein [Acaryochloris marina]ABW28982.1 hypothetical protein AM1_3999 [Acaryochloris marina MBIC11017]